MPRSSRPKEARNRRDAERRLARLLDGPHRTAIVAQLAPETLCRLIRHRGLDASVPLVASATPERLTAVLDLDLWRSPGPGLDEHLDTRRFGEWIEALVESDVEQAARVVASMDPDLVVAGLSRHLRVFDVAALLPPSRDDFEPVDPTPEALEREIGGYVLRARSTEAWDAIVRLLTTLAADHGGAFDALMRGCRRLSDSAPEVDGLDELLGTSDQLLYDLGVERDDRRGERGYLSAAEARAFLRMARRVPGGAEGANPIAAAYLRSTAASGTAPDPPMASGPGGPDGAAVSEAVRRVAELLDEAGVERPRPRGLLSGPAEDGPPLSRIRRLMEHLPDRDAGAYLARSRELAFLANAFLSGCSLQSRSLTPREARDAAVAVCNLGLERRGDPLADEFFVDHDLVSPFEAGWAVLFEDVSTYVSRTLLRTLAGLRPPDPDTRMALRRLSRELSAQCEAGTPWRAREALDPLAMLDTTVWASLVGLLDECPVVPAAMTAILERRSGPVSPTAFDFISTTRQIDAVHAFAAELPTRLRRD